MSAIGQNSVKRMLAYSSIAHAGYMLMGLLTLDTFGLGAILFYILAYCGMNFGAFWVVSIVADLKGSDRLDAFRGLGWSMPVLGVTMVIFLASLAGIPMFFGLYREDADFWCHRKNSRPDVGWFWVCSTAWFLPTTTQKI
ncbi:MAG: proton-conducting transporter membrane subunit [Bdellovibrionota bacterium]